MTTPYTFDRKSKYALGVVTLALASGALLYVLDDLAPRPCNLLIVAVGITLEGLRALCLLADLHLTVCAGLWQNLHFLHILTRIFGLLMALCSLMAG